MTWPAPHRDDALVVAETDGDGWLYDPDGRLPYGDWHWTAHLTNALHDAGWWVTQQRRKQS